MPSDPEKNIEPLLKAFAEKRRQAVGGDPALSAATRARLQAEVRQRWPVDSAASTAPTTSTVPDSLSPTSTSGGWGEWFLGIKSFWPRLAAAGFILLLLGGTVWMMTPPRREQNLAAFKAPKVPEPSRKPQLEAEGAGRMADELATATTPTTPTVPSSVTDSSRRELADPLARSASRPAPSPAGGLASATTSPGAAPALEARVRVKVEIRGLEPAPTPANVLTRTTSTFGEALPTADTNLKRSDVSGDNRLSVVNSPNPNGNAVELSKAAADRYYRYSAATDPSGVAQRSEIVGERQAGSQNFFQNIRLTESLAAAPAPKPTPTTTRNRGGAAPLPGEASRAPASPSPVLANFALEQKGPALRVIDFDGSIYSGRIIPVSVSGRTESPSLTLGDRPGGGGAGGGGGAATANRRLAIVQRAPDAAPEPASTTGFATADTGQQSLAFEVMGTNTTLRQSVVFTGTLVMGFFLTNNVPEQRVTLQQQDRGAVDVKEARPQGLSGLGAGAVNSPVSPNARVLRIQGLGRYGGTNEVSVDAVPAPR